MTKSDDIATRFRHLRRDIARIEADPVHRRMMNRPHPLGRTLTDPVLAADADACRANAAMINLAIPDACIAGLVANMHVLRDHLAIVRATVGQDGTQNDHGPAA